MVVVAGSGRSGTSCIAGILLKLGVPMGKRFRHANANNESGYWEDFAFRKFLRRTFGQGDVANNTPEDRTAWLRQYAESRREAAIVGIKYPAACFILPEMAAVWPNLKVIATNRSEEDVKASLRRAHWWNNRRCAPSAYPQRRDAAIAEHGIPALQLDFKNEVVRNPAAAVDAIIAFLGIEPTPSQREAAIAHVRPELCHVNPPQTPSQADGRPTASARVDVVYPLSNGSHWDNNELRYSLRSLEKYALNLGRVFVVGPPRKPD